MVLKDYWSKSDFLNVPVVESAVITPFKKKKTFKSPNEKIINSKGITFKAGN